MTNRTTLGISKCLLILSLAWWAAGDGFCQDLDWPRTIVLPEGEVTVYQPQPEQFERDQLRARGVVSVKPAGSEEPVFGVVWFAARLQIDREARTAAVEEVHVADVRFPNASDEGIEKLKQLLETEIPTWDLTLSLDQLLVSLETVDGLKADSEKLRNSPPKIVFAKRPSVLLTLDGEPILRPIEGSEIQAVANTPYPIAWDQRGKQFYLALGETWYRASVIRGPWVPAAQVPDEVLRLLTKPEEDAAEEDEAAAGTDDATGAPPAIIVATEPTELIATNGEPSYVPIESGALLYVDNTENDLLLDVASQQHYVLFSGRWYRAASLEASWRFVEPEQLPETFKQIPEESPVGHLLNHVPGTDQAREAVLDAYLPQTATVERSATTEVTFDGEPKFEKIPGTSLEYAVNTPNTVLKSKQKYYACEQGVWYESVSAKGPWTVAVERPAQVESIPPESPVQHVRYVQIYESTPRVVYVGYTPGYVGTHIYGGTVVYGTGYVYRPWIGRVYYYPRPVTWGFRVRYDPWHGWAFGVGFRQGGFGFSFRLRGYSHYRPPYFGGWWGPGGYRPPYYRPPYYRPPGYRPPGRPPRPTPYQAANRANVYHRPQSVAKPISQPAQRPTTTPALQPAARPNNVLSDRDGNIYRQTDKGWELRDRSGWRDAPNQLPSTPSERPAVPSQRPAAPSQRPAVPAPRPGTPSQRPTPAVPGQARPSQRPAAPTQRPAAPTQRPARPGSPTTNQLDQMQRLRQRGAQRTDQFRRNSPARQPRGNTRPARRR